MTAHPSEFMTPEPVNMRARLTALRLAFPAFYFHVLHYPGRGDRIEALARRQPGDDIPGLYCLISVDAAEIWQELKAVAPGIYQQGVSVTARLLRAAI